MLQGARDNLFWQTQLAALAGLATSAVCPRHLGLAMSVDVDGDTKLSKTALRNARRSRNRRRKRAALAVGQPTSSVAFEAQRQLLAVRFPQLVDCEAAFLSFGAAGPARWC